MSVPHYALTDADIRYEYRVMVRWCRLFRKTDWDWVELAAEKFRDRHPVVDVRRSDTRAA